MMSINEIIAMSSIYQEHNKQCITKGGQSWICTKTV